MSVCYGKNLVEVVLLWEEMKSNLKLRTHKVSEHGEEPIRDMPLARAVGLAAEICQEHDYPKEWTLLAAKAVLDYDLTEES
jgi:hypothetical protein